MLRVLVHPLPDDPESDPVAPLRRRPPHIDVNFVDLPAGLGGDEKTRWLRQFVAENGTGFTLNDIMARSGSFIFDQARAVVFALLQGRERRNGRDGRPVNYFVYELKRRIVPEKAGTYTLGPAIVKGSFVDGMEGQSYTGRRLVAVAPAVTVEVREVPQPRPPTFCGGIGDFHVAASANPSALRVGDPLTFTLDLQRGPSSGSLDSVSAPDLAVNSKLGADFEIVDKNPTGHTQGDVKRFEYALRPRRAGVEIPPVTVTVFNPDTETFSEIATKPVALSVSNAGQLGAGDLVGSIGGSASEEIKAQATGIFQNVTDPAELSDERLNLVGLAAVAAGSWCLVGCLMVIVSSHRRKAGDVGWQRRRRARHAARARLAEARTAVAAGQSLASLRAIRAAVVGLIADMRNVVAEGLTARDVDMALAKTAVPTSARTAVLRLLETIESAEYGSGTASETQGLVETAEGLIHTLTRHLERGS
jgi:hypothetical protein